MGKVGGANVYSGWCRWVSWEVPMGIVGGANGYSGWYQWV